MEYEVKNLTNARRSVRTASGQLVAMDPGKTCKVKMSDDEVKSAERRGLLKVTPVKSDADAKAEADAKAKADADAKAKADADAKAEADAKAKAASK